MAGRAKALIDAIIDQRSKGNPTLASTTRTKLMLKGIDASKYTAATPDDPAVISKLQMLATELGVQVR